MSEIEYTYEPSGITKTESEWERQGMFPADDSNFSTPGVETSEHLTFALKIATGNAAVQDGNSLGVVRSALKEALSRIDEHDSHFPIKDINGNKIGECRMEVTLRR